MTIERYQTIRPLLMEQPYIDEVIYSTDKCDHNLDDFRQLWQRDDLNIAQRFLTAFNLPLSLCEEPWLTVPDPIKMGKSVAINRTWDRHHNPLFCWPEVLENYGRNAVFLGLEIDYQTFREKFRTVGYELPWYQCEDLLEAARVIAGVDFFVGNQSACYAIAEGLKMLTYVEVSHQMPNCIFERKSAHYFPDPRCMAAASASGGRIPPPST